MDEYHGRNLYKMETILERPLWTNPLTHEDYPLELLDRPKTRRDYSTTITPTVPIRVSKMECCQFFCQCSLLHCFSTQSSSVLRQLILGKPGLTHSITLCD